MIVNIVKRDSRKFRRGGGNDRWLRLGLTTDLVVIPFRERWELKFKFFTEANFKQFKRNSKFLKQNEKVFTNPPYYEQYTFVGGGGRAFINPTLHIVSSVL